MPLQRLPREVLHISDRKGAFPAGWGIKEQFSATE